MVKLNDYLKEKFGEKVYKLSLDGGFTCPNRDGKLDTRGCIFCLGGSGDFAIPCEDDVFEAIENAKSLVKDKNAEKYIAYFQSYTSTYGPVEKLERLFVQATSHPDVVALSIGTRPDCLGDDILELLGRINRIKPVWVELGLQTIHEKTAEYIRRGYDLKTFDRAVKNLKQAGIEVIVHMIIGLPGETDEMIWQTAEYIGKSGADGIKFQLLHVLKGTDLEKDYNRGLFKALSIDEYIRILIGCVKRIPENMVVHRLTGDGAKRDLVAPMWSADKKKTLNAVNSALAKAVL